MEKKLLCMWWEMKNYESPDFKKQLMTLREEFKLQVEKTELTLGACMQAIVEWEFSLGESGEMIPFENLIPDILYTKSRTFSNPTEKQLNSKRLCKYGYDKDNILILSSTRPHQDTKKYGEFIRFRSGDLILHGQIFANDQSKNRLMSITQITNETNMIHYITVNPPHNWALRTDFIQQNKIHRSSMMATTWKIQVDYDFIYSASGSLEKILHRGNLHWPK